MLDPRALSLSLSVCVRVRLCMFAYLIAADCDITLDIYGGNCWQAAAAAAATATTQNSASQAQHTLSSTQLLSFTRALSPHRQAAILASRSAAHAHHDKREAEAAAAAAAAYAAPQHQNSSNNCICMLALLPALCRLSLSHSLSLPLLRLRAYAPTALRPLLLSGTFYESQRLFRSKLIIFTAYAVVDCCCCCALLLLLLLLLSVVVAAPLSFCMCCAFNQFNAKISPAIHFSSPAETCLFITLAFI